MRKIASRNLKKLLILPIFILGCYAGLAQNTKQKSDFWKKVRFGGGVGVGFNNAGYNASISPSAIYQVSDNFSAGINTNVIFSKVGDSSFKAYGGGAIALYNPVQFIQLSSEYEHLRVNQSLGDIKNNFWAPALFVGIGYTNKFSTIGMRYNVLENHENSIYFNAWSPFIRFYF